MLDLVLGLDFATRHTQTQFATGPRPKAIAVGLGQREARGGRRRSVGATCRQIVSTAQKRLPSGSAWLKMRRGPIR
ncbi:MAG: hypothetical protein ACRDNP_04565 [Gaiellaceae bacterium]